MDITPAFAVPIGHAFLKPCDRLNGELETLFLSPKFVPTVVVGFSILGFASAIGIFDPFTRLETSRNRDTGGVGLGLAVSRTIAREHGGDVKLSNRTPAGLRARLELPS